VSIPSREDLFESGFTAEYIQQIDEHVSMECGFPALIEGHGLDPGEIHECQIIAPLNRGGIVAVTINDIEDDFKVFIFTSGGDDEEFMSFKNVVNRIVEALTADRAAAA
jgi:hypothetical protein